MSTFRIHKSKNYTVMSNHHFQNENLSLRAMGLLSYMLSKPDNWSFSIEGIASKCKDGKESVRSAVNELVDNGYIVRRSRTRDEKGHLKEAVYDVYESPEENPDFKTAPETQKRSLTTVRKSKKKAAPKQEKTPMVENPTLDSYGEKYPMADFPTLGNPTVAKPTEVQPTEGSPSLLNTNILNTNLLNTNLSINQVSSRDKSTNVENSADVIDVIDEMDFERAIKEVEEQISADILYHDNQNQSGVIDELIEIIATVYTTERSHLKIGGNNLDIVLVRKRLRSLDSGHIEYVLECIANCTAAIRNRRSYLLTCLYYAPVTIDGYYANQVAHDLARGG